MERVAKRMRELPVGCRIDYERAVRKVAGRDLARGYIEEWMLRRWVSLMYLWGSGYGALG